MTEPTIIQTPVQEDFIDLGLGNPDPNLLPLDLLRDSAEAFFTAGDARPLQYGAERGDGYFRASLAEFLTGEYGFAADPGRMFVTAGASSALDLLCTLYTQPGDVILVEEPTYFLALRIFEDHGLRIVPLAMDADGLMLDDLDHKLAEHRPKMLYTVPTFQNPSGRTLSQARREALVERANRHKFLIAADEAYQLLPYAQTLPPSFAAFTAASEQVASVNSFSKILAPGVRLGWITAHEAIISKLAGSGLLDSGGGMNPVMSALVRGLVESGGLAENVGKLRKVYAERLAVLDDALKTHLPQAEYSLPQGGFFIWVRLPGMDTAELRAKARDFKVGLRQGALFSSQGGMREYLRASFCYYSAGELEEGVRRLAACVKGEG